MPKLLSQARELMRYRHYSYRTEKSQVFWIKRFIHFHGLRHPSEMGREEVTTFLSHLAAETARLSLDAEPGTLFTPLPLPRCARQTFRLAHRGRAGASLSPHTRRALHV